MGLNIHNVIAAINPKVYCMPFKNEYGINEDIIEKVEKIKKENKDDVVKGIIKAASVARIKEPSFMDYESKSKAVIYGNAFEYKGLKNPIEKHFLSYDAFSENLEPIYFWILQTLEREYKDFDKIEKIIDNFSSSPGSGHFSEIGGKATRMQDEAMKILGGINNIIKSILNLIYDLKEFRLRLDTYENLKNPELKDSAYFSLKQIWMDTVDMKRGTTSLKGLMQQLQYVTIIDAFMACSDVKRVNELDLNDRVKRILEQRIVEFNDWIIRSEQELRKRYEVEKNYLKSQYNSVLLYIKWAKPYLRAAHQLTQKFDEYNPDLVNLFNTSVMELTLLCLGKYVPIKDVGAGVLPEIFKYKKIRNFKTFLLIELKFRSVPERAGQQGYGFRGKVDITLTSYALRDDELSLLKEVLKQDDMMDAMGLIEGATTESIEKIRDDIDFFIKDLDEKKQKEIKANEKEETNPFTALFSFTSKKEEKDDKLSPDSEMEKVARSQAILQSRIECAKFYGMYKKAHDMPAF
jgi:hypothetical protein